MEPHNHNPHVAHNHICLLVCSCFFFFFGAVVEYVPKSGECQKCCNAGGPITLKSNCISNCEGFSPQEKTVEGQCDGEADDVCKNVVCDKG